MFGRHIRRMRGIRRRRRDLLAGHAPMVQLTGIAAGGHALVRMPPSWPDGVEVITRAARAGLALEGLSGYHVGGVAAEPLDPALVIGYGVPAGRSYRVAVAALADFLRSVYSPR